LELWIGKGSDPAPIEHYGTFVPPDTTHTVYVTTATLDADMRSAMRHAISVYSFVDEFAVVEWTTSSGVDVTAHQGNFGNVGYWAYGRCATTSQHGGSDPHEWCKPQLIYFNMTHPTNWDGTPQGRRAVACHELGHTMGLRHSISSQSSCMRDARTSWDNITTHDEAMLNGWYPWPP
jgi:predicted Zn-dependent protease